MRSQLPDTSVVRALRSLTPGEIEKELREADLAVNAAIAYRDWLRYTKQALDAIQEPVARRDTQGELPQPPPRLITERPPLRRAILMLLSEERRPWRKKEIFQELERRGWLPQGQTPDKQLTNRVSEMARRGEVVRIAPGVVSLPGLGLAGAPSSGDGKG